jgi:hypothetical protein
MISVEGGYAAPVDVGVGVGVYAGAHAGVDDDASTGIAAAVFAVALLRFGRAGDGGADGHLPAFAHNGHLYAGL